MSFSFCFSCSISEYSFSPSTMERFSCSVSAWQLDKLLLRFENFR